MSDNIKILILSPYLPAIDTSACARKVYDCIALLKQRGHSVYLLSFCSEQDKERISLINRYCAQIHLEYLKDYSRYPHSSTSFRQKVSSICNNEYIDILQCEKAYIGRYVPGDIKSVSILVEHEVLSASFYERARLERNAIKKIILFARAIKKYFEQNRWYNKFNKIIVFSESDKNIINRLYKIDNIGVIPLGINLGDYPLPEKKEKLYDLIFVGNFSHQPNTDAALYFYKNIMPLIKNRLPDVSFVIAGANPPRSIKNLANFDRNVYVAGYIKDISEIYSNSKVFIAPLRFGTGMRFKILEAMALGIPVVSTSVGARGIFKENIKIADTPGEFTHRVIELLQDEHKRRYLSEKARLFVEKNYSYDIILDRYEDIYNNLKNNLHK